MQNEGNYVESIRRAARACLLLMPFACSSPAPISEPSDEVGTLEIDLTAPDQNGRTYRLRDAQFLITSSSGAADGGAFGLVLSSENALDEARITERLHPGGYRVALQPGWRMEDVTAAPVDVPATLLSQATVFFDIRRFRTSFVTYQFGVNGDPLAFGGDVSIGISVTSVDAGAPP